LILLKSRRVPGVDRHHSTGNIAPAIAQQIFHHAFDVDLGQGVALQRDLARDILTSAWRLITASIYSG
jgi:hypothetical protein